MKMVECMEDEGPSHPKGETRRGITKKLNVGPSNGGKGLNKHKWGQGEPKSHENKEKSMGKELTTKKVKWDMKEVKCFNYNNHGHLVKDCPKPP
jgi:hypothetical protein